MTIKPDKLRQAGINLHRYVDHVGKYQYQLDVAHQCVDVVRSGWFRSHVHTSIDVTQEQIATLIR